jgi:hypothetical protein
MSKYRLRIPVEKINFQQWKEIFNVLKEYDDLRYVIMRNQEESLAEWFEDNLMHLAYLVSMSPNYNINDRYVLYDIDHNLILSGDERLILSVLSIHMKKSIELYLALLETDDIRLSMILEEVFDEYDA